MKEIPYRDVPVGGEWRDLNKNEGGTYLKLASKAFLDSRGGHFHVSPNTKVILIGTSRSLAK